MKILFSLAIAFATLVFYSSDGCAYDAFPSFAPPAPPDVGGFSNGSRLRLYDQNGNFRGRVYQDGSMPPFEELDPLPALPDPLGGNNLRIYDEDGNFKGRIRFRD